MGSDGNLENLAVKSYDFKFSMTFHMTFAKITEQDLPR